MATEPSATTAIAGRNTGIDWSAQLDAHGGWLRSVLAARLSNRDAVDDVMQEVALAAVRAKNPPASHQQVAPWLYKVAIRQAMLQRRRLGRQRKLQEKFQQQVQLDESPDPLKWLLDGERNGRIRRILDGLPQRDREILLLKYTQDWSYREIGQHLGISQAAVEARLHRARQRMRTRLTQQQVVNK